MDEDDESNIEMVIQIKCEIKNATDSNANIEPNAIHKTLTVMV